MAQDPYEEGFHDGYRNNPENEEWEHVRDFNQYQDGYTKGEKKRKREEKQANKEYYDYKDSRGYPDKKDRTKRKIEIIKKANEKLGKGKKDEELNEIIEDPLDDAEIKHYLGQKAKILKYSELAKYKSIDELLPNKKDFAVLLYEESPNVGHWVCLLKYPNTIEFFDPYGGKPDSQLNWLPKSKATRLGQGRKLLSALLDHCSQKVVYNPIAYQKESPEINNCGRHCVYRILCMMNGNMNLEQYYKHIKELERKSGLDADGVVSSEVDIV